MRPSSALLVGVVKLLVGAYARWIGSAPSAAQRIYFANHTSHIDTLAIWSSLPRALRRRTRPIAARDYWGKGLKKYIATRGFGAVLIDRARENPEADPLEPLRASLREGDSLIIFPEGTRGQSAVPAPFRSGLFRLANELLCRQDLEEVDADAADHLPLLDLDEPARRFDFPLALAAADLLLCWPSGSPA